MKKLALGVSVLAIIAVVIFIVLDSDSAFNSASDSDILEKTSVFFEPTTIVASIEQPSNAPSVAFDESSGKMYVVYIGEDSDGHNLYLKHSEDGGKTFSSALRVNQNPSDVFLDGRVSPNVVVDDKGKIYVLWVKAEPAPELFMGVIRSLVFSYSEDGGKTFSTPSKISDDRFEFDGCVHVGAPMALDSKGNVHTVWYTGQEDGPGVYYAKSSDNAKTFSEPIPILTDSWVPPLRAQLTIDEKDNVWITWEDSTGLSANETVWRYEETQAMIYYAKITPQGIIERSTEPINIEEGRSPVIASGNGFVSIVWASSEQDIQCSSASV